VIFQNNPLATRKKRPQRSVPLMHTLAKKKHLKACLGELRQQMFWKTAEVPTFFTFYHEEE
jgi:hypothetical protein